MRVVTPAHELHLIDQTIKPLIAKLKGSQDLQKKVLRFAVKHGADELTFPIKFRKLIRGARPTAYFVTLLLLWEREERC